MNSKFAAPPSTIATAQGFSPCLRWKTALGSRARGMLALMIVPGQPHHLPYHLYGLSNVYFAKTETVTVKFSARIPRLDFLLGLVKVV